MSRPYNNAVITDAGIDLLDKAQTGQASIQFTRMAAGSGIYTTEDKDPSVLRGSTGLKLGQDSYGLSSVDIMPDDGIKLTSLFTNQDPATGEVIITEGYYINEIGLYAREKGGSDDTEILYSITVATDDTGDYMPPYNGGPPAQIIQEYRCKVSNAAEVSIDLTGAGAAMLVEEAEARFQGLTDMIQGLIETDQGLAEMIQGLTETVQGLQEKQERDRADIDYIALMRGVDL